MSLSLTPHFALDEFACRDGGAYPAEWIATRLLPLCRALEVVREKAGKPITILSGYRSEAYNRRIKGARQSQHVQGRAADFTVRGMTAAQVHALVLGLVRDGAIVIGGLGSYPGFTHIDVRPSSRLVRWGGSRREG